jgi:hypothetical protein
MKWSPIVRARKGPRIENPEIKVLRGTRETNFIPDKKGWFKVQIDRRKKTRAPIP